MERKYEVNHLEFIGDKAPGGEAEGFFRAYGAEYEHIAKNQGAKYIITEVIESGNTIVRFDSMNLNWYVRLLPDKEGYKRVDSHPGIFELLYPDHYKSYSKWRRQYSEALTTFDRELERKGITLSSSDKKYWEIFKETQEYNALKRTEGIKSVRGGYLSYNPEKQTLELEGKSGNYGKPLNEDLIGLAPILLREAIKIAPVRMVKLEDGKKFLKKSMKTQMLEEMIVGFNNQHIAVEE